MKKSIKYLVAFLLCVLFCTNGVKAKSYVKELFQADDKLKITEELDGTAFLAGNKVTVENKINGIGFIAGETVNINYDQEYVAAAGANIFINSNIEKEAFLAASSIDIKGKLGRDAYMFGDDVTIDGTVDRNLYLYGNSIELKGNFNGNVYVSAANIKIDKNTKINGTLKYNDDAKITGLTKSIRTKTYKTQEIESVTFKNYLISFINKLLHIVMFAIVLVFLCESLLVKSLEQTKDRSAKNILSLCGKGCLILIGVPIIAFMLLLTNLFTSVGVVGAIVYGILIYISEIFTGYFIAKVLDELYFKKNLNSYLLVIIGLVIISVLSIIPVLGSFIAFISMILGLGISGNMIIELKK